MNAAELKERTKTFALRVLKLVDALPETRSGRILANQLGRSGTSVGANYRAACRSRSTAEMISKLAVVEEEADESAFWLELVAGHGVRPMEQIAGLHREAGELTAIMVASRRTLSRRAGKSRIESPKSKIR
jgi:four helix bundle protein